jgi:hypothetical protein
MSTSLSRLARGALVALLAASLAAPAHAASRLPSEKHWRKDVSHAMSGSRGYLHDVLAVGGGPFAVNLDIDNTSLATHYRPGSPVLAVRAFARYAHQHHIAVMFDTGRLQSHLKSARTLLRKAGFPITEMCGRAARSERLDQSKPRCREQFVSEGYTIIANVGNNPTDFSGVDDYGRAFRLPNYGGQLG